MGGVDKTTLQQTLEAYEQVRTLLEEDGLTLREALAYSSPSPNSSETSILAWTLASPMAAGLKRSLASCSTRSWSQPWRSHHLPGDLAPLQQAGLNWLGFLDALGFGACLADDMGLGKTIQLLAFLSVKKRRSHQPAGGAGLADGQLAS